MATHRRMQTRSIIESYRRVDFKIFAGTWELGQRMSLPKPPQSNNESTTTPDGRPVIDHTHLVGCDKQREGTPYHRHRVPALPLVTPCKFTNWPAVLRHSAVGHFVNLRRMPSTAFGFRISNPGNSLRILRLRRFSSGFGRGLLLRG